MDFLSFVKNEFFRPIATLLIPGSIAFFPWAALIASVNAEHLVQNTILRSINVQIAIFLSLALAVGMLLENLGSRIECLVEDYYKSTVPGHKNRWDEYLKLAMQDEIVGQRYLRTILVRLKFELSIIPAVLIAFIGFVVLNSYLNIWSIKAMPLFAILVFVFEAYMVSEVFKSVKVLDETRGLIIEAKKKVVETI